MLKMESDCKVTESGPDFIRGPDAHNGKGESVQYVRECVLVKIRHFTSVPQVDSNCSVSSSDWNRLEALAWRSLVWPTALPADARRPHSPGGAGGAEARP